MQFIKALVHLYKPNRTSSSFTMSCHLTTETLQRQEGIPAPQKPKAIQNPNRHVELNSFSPTASAKGQKQAQNTTNPNFKELFSFLGGTGFFIGLNSKEKNTHENDQAIRFPLLSHSTQHASPWTLLLVIIHWSDHKTEFPPWLPPGGNNWSAMRGPERKTNTNHKEGIKTREIESWWSSSLLLLWIHPGGQETAGLGSAPHSGIPPRATMVLCQVNPVGFSMDNLQNS